MVGVDAETFQEVGAQVGEAAIGAVPRAISSTATVRAIEGSSSPPSVRSSSTRSAR